VKRSNVAATFGTDPRPRQREERIRALQDEYQRETDWRPTRAAAAVMLDRQEDAEHQRRASVPAPTPDPDDSPPTWCECCGGEGHTTSAHDR